MGSRARKRKAFAKQRDALVARIESAPLPQMEAVKVISELRAITSPDRAYGTGDKPEWVTLVESSGRQYVGGDRARGVMQTQESKRANRADIRARKAAQPSEITREGVRRTVNVRTGRVVKVESITRTVPYERVREGERVEYAAPELGETIVAGCDFLRDEDWHAVKVTKRD